MHYLPSTVHPCVRRSARPQRMHPPLLVLSESTDTPLIALLSSRYSHPASHAMSKRERAGELEAAALTAWTPLQQAALHHRHIVKQSERDEAESIKRADAEEEKKKKGEENVRPEGIQAGRVIDDLVRVVVFHPCIRYVDELGYR